VHKFSSQQLASFCRVLAMVVFEPEVGWQISLLLVKLWPSFAQFEINQSCHLWQLILSLWLIAKMCLVVSGGWAPRQGTGQARWTWG
jgi:hypothetical protein